MTPRRLTHLLYALWFALLMAFAVLMWFFAKDAHAAPVGMPTPIAFTIPTVGSDSLCRDDSTRAIAVVDSFRVYAFPRAHWPWSGYAGERPEGPYLVAQDSLSRPAGSYVALTVPLFWRVSVLVVDLHGRAGWGCHSNGRTIALE